MGPLKGIHALATLLFSLFAIYMSWEFIYNFYNSISDPILSSIMWISLIIFIIIITLGIPALIALNEESEASIVSAAAGLAVYFSGILFMRIFTPIIEMFIGGDTLTIGALQETTGSVLSGSNSTLAIQIMSLLWIIAALLVLLILPVMAAAAPELNEKLGKASSTTKEALS